MTDVAFVRAALADEHRFIRLAASAGDDTERTSTSA